MKLAQLIPIENCIINGYSLVENVFGAGFVVYDVLGTMHTTAKNVKLLARAQVILEELYDHDAESLASALTHLRAEADLLDQADYEQSVQREMWCPDDTEEALALAGCLA